MIDRCGLLAGVAVMALCTTGARAQEAAPPVGVTSAPTAVATADADEIVVTGVRASLRSAQARKESSGQISDSIVAEDIGKLPDKNVADALQRITGIQISRDFGEGGSVAIRGLPQVQTTINGREVFTAGTSRTLDFKDFPAELLAGVDVYKSPTANLIEGGIGGNIDLRTRRPFDFNGFQLSGQLRANYSDLVDKVSPQASVLVSNRWETGIGEIGALLSVSYQKRDFRNDLATSNGLFSRKDITPGTTYAVPNGFTDTLQTGYRERLGVNAVVQWKATDSLEFYAGFDYSHFPSQQYMSGTILQAGGLGVVGTPTTFPGTNDVAKITYANAPILTYGASRRLTHDIKQFNAGGKWSNDKFKVTVDGDYTKSYYDLQYREAAARIIVPLLTQDFSTPVPSVVASGIDLSNPANYTRATETYSVNRYDGKMTAIRFDAEYQADLGPLESILFGGRFANRDATFSPIRDFNNLSGSVNLTPNLFQPIPQKDYFNSTDGGVPLLRDYIRADPYQMTDILDVRTRLGITTPVPAVNPLSVFQINEKTYAGYAMGKFAFEFGVPIDGNIGLRVVQTKDTLRGNRQAFTSTGASTFTPVNRENTYTDWLPSFNIRARLTEKLSLRFAASKVVTRPNFDQLTPSTTLIPSLAFGGSGNPDLKPLRANQLDTSLEWYFNSTGNLYVAGFYKKIDGFIVTTGVEQVIDGIRYTINQPTNGGKGEVKGFEVGYTQFFDFLPGLLSGLGAQANYTFVSSVAPTPAAGFTTTLPQLSKNSYNLIGIYEKGPVSARVAYNWRSKFYDQLYSGGAGVGNTPVYRAAYGWLDASLSYDVTKQVTVTVDGSNLLQTKRTSYYLAETRPFDRSVDDRQFSVGARFSW